MNIVSMNKRILIIGGTGTMGRPLVDMLISDSSNDVWVVSRHCEQESLNKHIVVGNAFDISFLNNVVLCRHYDAIVDFMWYDETRFAKAMPLLLKATDQYMFLSSAAVYVEYNGIIDETTPRDYDVASEDIKKSSKEYNMVKARMENMLRDSGKTNWTIIRPHLTFNSNRIPLGSWEMNIWLYRAVCGFPVAFPQDLLQYKTTLTHGSELAHQIKNLIGCKGALGEDFQLGSEKIYTWQEILEFIYKILKSKGYDLKIYFTDALTIVKYCPWNENCLMHNRMRNLCFSTKKYKSVTGDGSAFPEVNQYLEKSINDALEKFKYSKISRKDVEYIYAQDKMVGTFTPIKHFKFIASIFYVLYRVGIPSSVMENLIHPKLLVKRFLSMLH